MRKLIKPVSQVVFRHSETDAVRLGSEYGGWWVPTPALGPKGSALLAGVGEDTSLEEELLARGLRVHSVDPTPRAIEYVRKRVDAGALAGPNFSFAEIGLWSEPTRLSFYLPEDPSHVSLSATNRNALGSTIQLDVTTLQLAAEAAGFDPNLVKLDIEGAETEVLRMIPEADWLLVEVDSLRPVEIIRMLLRLRRKYHLVHTEGRNLTLERAPAT